MIYNEILHNFEVGEVLKNNNGYKYEVLKIINSDTIKFKRIEDGEIVEAYLPKMYLKNNKYEVLEWRRGKYYPNITGERC
ncbi:hypothetical protein FDB50_15575 [Clostridium botulinum]|uniref:DUF1653 domain-containing protein n=1 Tax=Clostridium botulinum TaxID=1491 RepID=A0A846JT90_CLOBO|nr:hypothetical protein [Clostridium botulinum]NFL43156.1 hypothetical protein [Clostridium botulinum]NFN06124.1 hypothetical protein [Clostridium botulinum]NFN36460.1 hypothetical protein [Clostridium botulinum]HBJ1645847.1 hypothetical protein [Clostridium botulinum]